MNIETKFDMDQEVFFINRHEEILEKRIVIGIKLEVWKFNGIKVTPIYRLDNHTWTSEHNLFSSEGIASEELLKYQKL